MNILITGVNGFIGGNLKKYFHKKHTIFSISRSGAELMKNSVFLDLTDISLVKEVFETNFFEQKIDLIIHCAAVLSNPENNENIDVLHANNAITESMIYIAKKTKTSRIINMSTIGVYPNLDGTYNEKSYLLPSANNECLYSLSKICSEELFSFYLSKEMTVVNLRLGQTYGYGMREDRIFSIMKNELKNDNSITVFGNGERISNFISITYLIQKIEEIIAKTEISGTYNLGEKNMTYLELAEMIIKDYGDKFSKIILKDKGVKSKVLIDSSKILKVLNQ